MRIEAITRIRDTDDDGSPVRMEPGDTLTVGDAFGAYACGLGWARDTEGKVETGERRTHPVKVKPRNVVSEQKAKTK